MSDHSTTGDYCIFTNCYTGHNYCVCPDMDIIFNSNHSEFVGIFKLIPISNISIA